MQKKLALQRSKDLRQSKEYANFLSLIGWKIEKINNEYFFIKQLSFLGSAIKLQRTDKINYKDLEKLSKKYKAFQIIIEPNKKDSLLSQNKFRISNTPYLPTKTLQINISKSNEEIVSQMKKDGRYSLRKSEKQKVKEQKSIEKFREDWFSVVKHKRHVLPLSHLNAFKDSFNDNMILLENSKGTAGGMFLMTKDIAYYWIGFTSNEARDTLVQYQIIWSGIQWAKKRGAKIFDFEGIYDARFPINGWQGFTHFKKSFGGQEIEYPGSFTKWRLPF